MTSPVIDLLAAIDLDPAFPAEVEEEAARLAAAPGLDEPGLHDLEGLPFVTIDGPGALDLDQAVHLGRDPGGIRLHYALADAAHFVRPGTALFREALRRGASFYAPGLVIPMLPRVLSEGVVSLNPEVTRRALVFDILVDQAGRAVSTRLLRARVRSRAKLTFADVDAFLAAPKTHAFAVREYAESLALLGEVGRARAADAASRHVVRHRGGDSELVLDGDRLAVQPPRRSEVEQHNAELSLLCNSEGGRFLVSDAGSGPRPQAIYKIHPAPDPARLAQLADLVEEVVARRGLAGDVWHWKPTEEPLAHWLARLPEDAPHDRIARALMRQAVLVNVRSTFATDAGEHHGVGAQPYARFSSPMREIAGIFVHKEAVEKLGLEPRRPVAEDEALMAEIVASANAAKQRQRRLDDLVFQRFLDQVFGSDAALPPAQRPARTGTVVGITQSTLHVTLDDPRIDVKIAMRDLMRYAGRKLEPSPAGGALLDASGRASWVLGDAIQLVVTGRDRRDERWLLAPVQN